MLSAQCLNISVFGRLYRRFWRIHMPLILSRRALLAGAASMLATPSVHAQTTPDSAFEKRLGAIEKREGGRFGVAAFDSGSGRRLAHRGNERFALCSTFKFLAAAAILAQVDQGKETLGRRIAYSQSDILEYSPVTEKHVGEGGMTVGALCAAAVQLSDNTAGNLLLAAFGGPAGLTGFCRSLGDSVTRLDRIEPFLNDVPPGDERDTTTPAAMIYLMERLHLGDALTPTSRAQLDAWMAGTTTGAKRLPATLPQGWRIGHKTGTGQRGATNDVAIFWPPNRPPVLIAAYFAESSSPMEQREAAIAEAGRAALESFG
jgi:beta-lactamase class A